MVRGKKPPRLVCHSFTNSVGRWLSAWNYPEALAPRLVRDISVPEDLSARAGRDATIAAMSGLRPSRSYIEETYGGSWQEASSPSAPRLV